MSLGPLMLDLEGLELTAEERELLCHPSVGGVILFSRNYESPGQLRRLTRAVHGLRQPRLLVATDQEGGRVQRLRPHLTRLPPPARLGQRYDRDRKGACRLAEVCGWLMAAELRALGVDLSFAPVLDLGSGASVVIGDRAFHRDPGAVAELGRAYMRGMQRAGMAAVGKHFPGHGSVEGDSHLLLPVDERSLETLRQEDVLAFERMIRYGLPALMAAHVVYARVDPRPAGFSPVWLGRILRQDLAFTGAVFSDDLRMAGAAAIGGPAERARAALDAGCDMVLVCHDRAGAVSMAEALPRRPDAASLARLARLHGRKALSWDVLGGDAGYRDAVKTLAALDPEPELDLGGDAPA